jgi:protein-disulfide isomerase
VSDADHVRGRDDAPATVVEYGDYECPYCAVARPLLVGLVEEGRIRLVFRNFPLADVHPYALTAALAAEAAGAQGRFWAMHDVLFTHQRRLRDADLVRYAAELGLRPASVIGDAAQPYGDKVEADFAGGVASGVRGTPTLFLDGRQYLGPVEGAALRSAIRAVHHRESGTGVLGGRSADGFPPGAGR